MNTLQSLSTIAVLPVPLIGTVFILWRTCAWVAPGESTGAAMGRWGAGSAFGFFLGAMIAAGFSISFGYPDVTSPDRVNWLVIVWLFILPTIVGFVLCGDGFFGRLALFAGLYVACIPLAFATTAFAASPDGKLHQGIHISKSIEGAGVMLQQAKAKNTINQGEQP